MGRPKRTDRPPCRVPRCRRLFKARGLCDYHYIQFWQDNTWPLRRNINFMMISSRQIEEWLTEWLMKPHGPAPARGTRVRRRRSA